MEYNFNVEKNVLDILTITANEGTKLTYWTDSEDIKNYSSFTIAYVKDTFDLSQIIVLTDQQDEEYRKQQDEAILKEIEEERMRKLNESMNLHLFENLNESYD